MYELNRKRKEKNIVWERKTRKAKVVRELDEEIVGERWEEREI
jgi:hypothetical protein